MVLQLTAEELKDWDAYREFSKRSLKLAPDGEVPFFVGKKKVQFSNDFKGHAFLVGEKSRIVVQTLRKQGVICQEGTCTKSGKDLDRATGVLPMLVKEARKTAKKLKLGYDIGVVPGENGEGGGDDPAARAALEAKLAKWKAVVLERAKKAIETSANGEKLKQLLAGCAKREQAGDLAGALEAYETLGGLLQKSAASQGGGASADLGPALAKWAAARRVAIDDLNKLGKAVAATKAPEGAELLRLLKAIRANLTEAPDTSTKVAALERYLKTDDVIADAESPNPFGFDLSLRQPLLRALEPLKTQLAAT